MDFVLQIFNHRETEAEAFDTELGFKEVAFCFLCSICYSRAMI